MFEHARVTVEHATECEQVCIGGRGKFFEPSAFRLARITAQHAGLVAPLVQNDAPYVALGCEGLARVDMFLQEDGRVVLNEVNTLPGTLYHHLWKASGIELEDLVTRLIKFAQEKFQEKNSYNFIFESSLLDLANSIKLNIDSEEKHKE